MKQIFLFLILIIAACTPADRNKVWLQEAERHYSQGNMDSTLSCLYKVNEDKLTGEDKYTFCRVKSSCSLASTPAEMELLYETVRYYEQKKDSAHLKAMRMILTQNFMFGHEYGRAALCQRAFCLFSSFIVSGLTFRSLIYFIFWI